MPLPIIEVAGLSKRYRLGQVNARSLREEAERVLSRLCRRGEDEASKAADFWALKDVSFGVQPGEVLGIIGRNGAGKSTLLKILSRVTEPTAGQVRLRGRVASLLEVGTGFHPELTGRENVYLNGAILGMSRAEINAKFDEIIDFAEIEKFLDTPVKRYSSGMYVRLAFAVAAHLDPEVLIVDEVLAVGDAAFQAKCMSKIGALSGREHRTILFVSHNMAAIRALSTRAILLEGGQISDEGSPEELVARHLRRDERVEAVALVDRADRTGDGRIRFTGVRFVGKEGDAVTSVTSGEPLDIELTYESSGISRSERVLVAISIWDQHQNVAALFASDEMGVTFSHFPDQGRIKVTIPKLIIRGGEYSVRLQVSYGTTDPEDICDIVEDAARLSVTPGDYWKSGFVNRQGAFSLIDARLSVEAL